MIKNLNEAYKIDDEKLNFSYLCNACGEVNDPSVRGDLAFHQPEDVMTPQEQELYYEFFAEGRYRCNLYVMRIDNEPYLAGCFLYTEDVCKDLLNEHRQKVGQALLTDEAAEDKEVELHMPVLFEAVKKAAERADERLKDSGFDSIDTYVGDNTDPDGHEILFAVHYSRKDSMDDIFTELDAFVDKAVGEEFEKMLSITGRKDSDNV